MPQAALKLSRGSSPVDIESIEASKENVVPIASGRSAKALTGLLSKDRRSAEAALKQGHEEFQREIAAINAQDTDDPLDVYHRYIRWTLSSYPSGPSHASQLVPLVEQTTRTFIKHRQYANDIRYLKLWILYTKYVDAPREIFRFLEANDIGTNAAAFYEEWAAVEEAAHNNKEADIIYNLGVHRKAEPLSRLEKRRAAFQARMLSLPLGERRRSVETNKPARPALGASTGTSAQPLRANTGAKVNGAAFAVFSDENGAASGQAEGAWSDFGTRDSRRRENHIEATQWKGEKMPMQTPQSQPLFEKLEVFRDPDAPLPKAAPASHGPELTTKPIRAPSEAEALRANPFHYYSASELHFVDVNDLATPTTPTAAVAPPKASTSKTVLKPTKSKPKTGSPLSAVQATAKDRRERVASPLEEIYPDDPNGNPKYAENSFEEIMAMRRGLYSRDGDLQQQEWARQDSQEWLQQVRWTGEPFHVDTNGHALQYHPVTEEPLLRYLKERAQQEALRKAEAEREAERQRILKENKEEEERRQERDTLEREARTAREPSPTVNTKDAIAQVNAMFGATLAFDQSAYGGQDNSETDDSAQSIEVEDFFPPVSQASQMESQAVDIASQAGDFVNNSFWGPVASQPSQMPSQISQRPASQQTESLSFFDTSIADESLIVADEPPKAGVPVAFTVFADNVQPKRKAPEASRFAPLINLMTPISEQTNEYTSSTRAGTSRLTGDLKEVPLLAEGDCDEEESPEDVKRILFKRKASNASSLKSVGEEEEDEETADQDEELQSLVRQTNTLNIQDSGAPQAPFLPHSSHILQELMGDSLEALSNVGYQKLLPSQANKLGMLRRSAKSRARRSGSKDDDTGVLLELGLDAFSVREKLGEGGFGAVFRIASTQEDDWDQDQAENAGVFALKVQQPASTFEFWILHKLRATLQDDARVLRSIIIPHALYLFADESHLLLEVCDQGTLLDAVNMSAASAFAPIGHSTGLDELLVMFFAIELLRTLEAIHTRGFLHGDFKIDNILVRLEDVPGGTRSWSSLYSPSGENGWSHKGVKVIDFGRCIEYDAFKQWNAQPTFATDFTADGRDCWEMRQQQPWSFETDYYGLAGIIWTMLFGSHFEAEHTLVNPSGKGCTLAGKPFRRYHQTGVWNNLFSLLLDPTAVTGSLPINDELSKIRLEMESWLVANCDKAGRSLKSLLKKLEIAQLSRQR